MSFSKQLIQWNRYSNLRELPWKKIKDPYKIWLSEIILQQTRALQGLPYYEKFIKKYPTIQLLAQAPEQEVFSLWQGLGYYSRCRNLIATAKYIVEQCKGVFPNNYNDLLKLKGVGPYTAAAIASFAFNEPVAVVDGNVYRVLSRVLGISTPIDSNEGKKEFASLAQQLLDKKQPASYNQAIMDFGATICLPKNPSCNQCPFEASCVALQKQIITTLPVKTKKLEIKTRHFHYLVFTHKNKFYIQQRGEKDIWPALWEFYLLESEDDCIPKNEWISEKPIYTHSQKLTHRVIKSYYYLVNEKLPKVNKVENAIIKHSQIGEYTFSNSIMMFFKNSHYLYENL